MGKPKKLTSVFTNDMEHCFFTGTPHCERHHIFGGYSSKARQYSEEDGYIIPLALHLHPNGAEGDGKNADLDLHLKRMAQKHFEGYRGTREQFIERYGKSYL